LWRAQRSLRWGAALLPCVAIVALATIRVK